jgi:hypothetical protein
VRTLTGSALGLLMLCAWRLTHLVVADDFPPVRWARGRLERGPEWLGDLVSCCYCAGVWVAGGLVLVADWVGSVPAPWLVFGALAAVVPIIEAAVARLEREPAASTLPPRPPQPTTYTRTRAGT